MFIYLHVLLGVFEKHLEILVLSLKIFDLMKVFRVHWHLFVGSLFLVEIQKVCWVYVIDGELGEILLPVDILGLDCLTTSLSTLRLIWLCPEVLLLCVLLWCNITFSRLTCTWLSPYLLARAPASHGLSHVLTDQSGSCCSCIAMQIDSCAHHLAP